MKAKHLSLAIAVLFAAGALWFAWSAWRSDQYASRKSSAAVGLKTSRGPNVDSKSAASSPKASQTGPAFGSTNRTRSGHMLQPPIPNRRFTDFTPEQRVQFARQGHGPGG